MIYGYLRVSSDEQDINSQKQGVEQFAKEHEYVIDEYITDEGVSGGKDPSKRNLGPLLKKIKKDDKIIASEISRLGRDLFMVMDILHFCMEVGCTIFTVKDRFTLGDDVQSKVLAFAFGLSAEIERQMIRQRTKEGLKLRMKLGILVGRPMKNDEEICTRLEFLNENKDRILDQYNWGVPLRRLAENFNTNRSTIARFLFQCGVKDGKWIVNIKNKRRETRQLYCELKYKDEEYCKVPIDRTELMKLIVDDLTVPQIQEKMPNYTYEQVYDTILCTKEYNDAYRRHGQLKIKKRKY